MRISPTRNVNPEYATGAGPNPFPFHTHCNFKPHINHDGFIKNTDCFSGDSYYPPNARAGHAFSITLFIFFK